MDATKDREHGWRDSGSHSRSGVGCSLGWVGQEGAMRQESFEADQPRPLLWLLRVQESGLLLPWSGQCSSSSISLWL